MAQNNDEGLLPGQRYLILIGSSLIILIVGFIFAGRMRTSSWEMSTARALEIKGIFKTLDMISNKYQIHEPSGNIISKNAYGLEKELGEGFLQEPMVALHLSNKVGQKAPFRKGFATKAWQMWKETKDRTGCGMYAASAFRDVIEQSGLKLKSKISQFLLGRGLPAAFWSRHGHGSAVDWSRKCGDKEVFGVEKGTFSDKIIFLDDVEGVKRLLRIEFADELKELETRAKKKGWPINEAINSYLDKRYEIAKKETVVKGAIYGMHIISFEDGLEAGLSGAFCLIPNDPNHYEEKETDCRRGSEKWKKNKELRRKKIWKGILKKKYPPISVKSFKYKP